MGRVTLKVPDDVADELRAWCESVEGTRQYPEPGERILRAAILSLRLQEKNREGRAARRAELEALRARVGSE